MKQIFLLDFEEIFQLLDGGSNFSLARYADGEIAFLKGHAINGIDGWSFNGDINNSFSKALTKSLNHTESNYYYGIPCQCCDIVSRNWYLNNLKCQIDNVTFSNIFVNGNHKKFLDRFLKYNNKPTVLIINDKVSFLKLTEVFNIVNTYIIKEYVNEFYNKDPSFTENKMINLANKHNNTLFLFAVGPLSEILIDVSYKVNPNNTYIDIGSALDTLFYNKITRDYQLGNTVYNKICVF